MLDIMRKSVNGFVGILLIALLVVAFGLWGIADTFTGFSNNVLAKVGDEEIERVEFQLRYLQQLQAIEQQFGTSVSPDQARSLGLDRDVLRNMIGSAALRATAVDLGLGQSDEALAAEIIADPNFAGPNGKFDEPTFRAVLQRNGLSEKLYVKDQRDFNIRAQMSNASYERAIMPAMMSEKLFSHFLERRVAKYLILTLESIDDVGEPTEEELESFYEQAKLRFTEAERRSADLLVLTAERFSENMSFSDEELRAEYEQSIDLFTQAEERAIDQLVLADDVEIAKVSALIAQNKPFVDIVRAAGQDFDNTDLGWVKTSDIISAELSEKAFAMEKGEISNVIEGPLGAVVLRVRDIKPEVVQSFEDVADNLRQAIALDRALEDMLAFSETVEDNRAAGVSLQEIGQRFDLPVVSVEKFTRDGTLEDGKSSEILQRYPSLLESLYGAVTGEDIAMFEAPDGSFVWAQVNDIQPSQVQPLTAVRQDAIAQWKVAEQAKLLEAMAAHLVSHGNSGVAFDTLAKDFPRRTLTSEPMTRQVSNDTFSEQAVERLFAVEKNKFAWAPVGFGSELLVMQAVDVIDAELKDGEAKDLIYGGELRKYRADLVNQFIMSLRTTYGVEVYDSAVQQALNQLAAR